MQKAENDWPEKKSDLESRLAAVATMPAEAERQWQASAELRRKVAANDVAGLDYAALIGAADAVHQESLELPQKSAELEALSGQLYDSWDKILVDLERARGRRSTGLQGKDPHGADALHRCGREKERDHAGRALGCDVARPVSGCGTQPGDGDRA